MCIPYLHDRAQSLSHLVMDTSPNLIMIIDDDMRIRECSVAAEMYFGVKPEAIKGKPLEDFINAHKRPQPEGDLSGSESCDASKHCVYR